MITIQLINQSEGHLVIASVDVHISDNFTHITIEKSSILFGGMNEIGSKTDPVSAVEFISKIQQCSIIRTVSKSFHLQSFHGITCGIIPAFLSLAVHITVIKSCIPKHR